MEEILGILTQLGLTEYESKAYISLVSLINAKADEISKNSGVPRSKIYPVLENLEKKDLIKIKQGRPLEYHVIAPEISLKNYEDNIIHNIHILQQKLTRIYEEKLPHVNTPIITVEGLDKILKKEYEIIKQTKKILYLRIGFILPSEIENIKKALNKLINNGIKIRILAVEECEIDGKVVSIRDIFEDMDVEIKYKQLPSAQLIIRDYKEMFLVFAENSGMSISNSNMVGLFNTYSVIISNYLSAFNKQWSKL